MTLGSDQIQISAWVYYRDKLIVCSLAFFILFSFFITDTLADSSSSSDIYEVKFEVGATPLLQLPFDQARGALGLKRVKLSVSVIKQPDLCYFKPGQAALPKEARKTNSSTFLLPKDDELHDSQEGPVIMDKGDWVIFEKVLRPFSISSCGGIISDDGDENLKVFVAPGFKSVCEEGGRIRSSIPVKVPQEAKDQLSEQDSKLLENMDQYSFEEVRPFLGRVISPQFYNTRTPKDNLLVTPQFADSVLYNSSAVYSVPNTYLPFSSASRVDLDGKSEIDVVREYSEVVSDIMATHQGEDYFKGWNLMYDLWCGQSGNTQAIVNRMDKNTSKRFAEVKSRMDGVSDYSRISFDKVLNLCPRILRDGIDRNIDDVLIAANSNAQQQVASCDQAVVLDLQDYSATGPVHNRCSSGGNDLFRETNLGLYAVVQNEGAVVQDLSSQTNWAVKHKFNINGLDHIMLGSPYEIIQSGNLRLAVATPVGLERFTVGGYSVAARSSCPTKAFYIVVAKPGLTHEQLNMSTMQDVASGIFEYNLVDDSIKQVKAADSNIADYSYHDPKIRASADSIIFNKFNLSDAIYILMPSERYPGGANGALAFTAVFPKFNSAITQVVAAIDEVLMTKVIGVVESVLDSFFTSGPFSMLVKIAMALSIAVTALGFVMGVNKGGFYDVFTFASKLGLILFFLQSEKRHEITMGTYVLLNKISRYLINVFTTREPVIVGLESATGNDLDLSVPRYRDGKLVSLRNYHLENSHLNFLDYTLARFFLVSTWTKIIGLCFTGLTGFIYAILIGYSSIVYITSILRALVTYFTAVVMTGILVAAMPPLLLSVLFKHTSKIFNAWIKSVVGIMLAPMIVMMALNTLDQVMGVMMDEVFGFSVTPKCYANYRSPAGTMCLVRGPMPSKSDSMADLKKIKLEDEEDGDTFFNVPISIGTLLSFVIFAHVMSNFMSMVDEVTVALTQTYNMNLTEIAFSAYDSIQSFVGYDDQSRSERAKELAKSASEIQTKVEYENTNTTPRAGPPTT